MGWEVAVNETHYGEFRRWVFFCNTSDKPFGRVFYLNKCYSKSNFYIAWNDLVLEDARALNRKGMLDDAIRQMQKYFGEEE